MYNPLNKIWSPPLFFDLVEIGEKERMTGLKKDGEKKSRICRGEQFSLYRLFLRTTKKLRCSIEIENENQKSCKGKS